MAVTLYEAGAFTWPQFQAALAPLGCEPPLIRL
jgi:hypothetical protein